MLSHSDKGYKAAQTGLLTVRDVAERLAISLATVQRLARAGELTKVTIGGSVRFEPGDVDGLVERGKRLNAGDDAELRSARDVKTRRAASPDRPSVKTGRTGRHERP